jgi:hypothetical protein
MQIKKSLLKREELLSANNIDKIVKSSTRTHLRPNDTPRTLNSISALIGKFILVIVVFFFLGYFVCEYFEIYPFESFESFDEHIYKISPKPVNESAYPNIGNQLISLFDNNIDNNIDNISNTSNISNNIDNDRTVKFYDNNENIDIDMNILRSNRYYNSVSNTIDNISRKQNNLELNQEPEMNINSLIQELPSTYMIKELDTIFKNSNKFDIKYNDKYKFNNINYLFNDKNNIFNDKKDYLELETRELRITRLNNNIKIEEKLGLLKKTDDEKELFYDMMDDIRILFSILKLYITTIINIQLLNSNYSHKAHPFQFLECVASQNIYFKNKKGILDLIFNIILYRQPKTHSFNIQCNINCQYKNNIIICEIKKLKLIGSTIQNDLPIQKIGMTPLLKNMSNNILGSPFSNNNLHGNIEDIHNINGTINPRDGIKLKLENNKLYQEWKKITDERNKYVDSSIKFNVSSINIDNDDVNNNKSKNLNMNIKKDMDLISNQVNKDGYNSLLYGDYKCFGINPENGKVITLNEIKDPISCQSYHKELDSVGIWDSKCKTNNDCPFYNEKNDDNKCNINTGECDMPLGITRIGYKYHNKF